MARDVNQEDIYQKKSKAGDTYSHYIFVVEIICLCSATDLDRSFLPEDVNSKAQIGSFFSKRIYQITADRSRFASLGFLCCPWVLPSINCKSAA